MRLRIICFGVAAVAAALAVSAASPSLRGGLTYAPWTARTGLVTFGATWPPGPWASFGPLGAATNDAVTSLPELDLFVTAGASPHGGGASSVRAQTAERGSELWTFDAHPFRRTEFAFVKPMRMGRGQDPALLVASVSGDLALLNSTQGSALSSLSLSAAPATWSAYFRGAHHRTPVPPFQSFLAVRGAGQPEVPIGVIVNAGGTAVFVLTSSPDGSGLALAATISCGSRPDGTDAVVLAVLHRGAGRVVVHCDTKLIELDTAAEATRTAHVSVAAVTTLAHSASAAHGAPVPGVAQTEDLQEVYFASRSSLQDSIVVGTVDFASGDVTGCTTIHTQENVKALRVMARNVTKDLTPSPAAIVVQTPTRLFTITPSANPGRCPWSVVWSAAFVDIAVTGATLQNRSPPNVIPEVGVVAVLSTQSETALLVALRLGTYFYIIDVLGRSVVWSETLPSGSNTKCYSPGGLNPLLVMMSPAMDRVVLGCPNLYYVVTLPDMARYGPASVTAGVPAGGVPPFLTQAGQAPVNQVVDVPHLLRGVIATAYVGRISTAYLHGSAWTVQAQSAMAQLDGVVFSVNPAGPSVGNLEVAVSATSVDGQDIWRSPTLPNSQVTTATVLRPFGPYVLAAVEGWALHVLNASSGAAVTSFTMPFECTNGQGNNFMALGFEHFVAVDPDFAAHKASGLLADASRATAMVFSFGTCEYALDRRLALRRLPAGGPTGGPTGTRFVFRVQLTATLVASVTPLGELSVYDLVDASNPQLAWHVQSPVFSTVRSADPPSLQVSGNVVAVVNADAVAVLLLSTGQTLWVDAHKPPMGGDAFFVAPSLAIYGSTVIVTTKTCITGYHVAPQPVDEAVRPNTKDGLKQLGTAPQQVQWRQFLVNFTTEGGTGRLSQYGRYIVTTGLWAAALNPATGAVQWTATLPPATWGAYPGVPKGFQSMLMVENIVSVVTKGDEVDTLWHIDETTGRVLQSTMSAQVVASEFATGRASFFPTPGDGPMLAVVTWPTFLLGRRVLPLPPAAPAVPETHVVVTPTFQRPTYAPATRAPIPELPVSVGIPAAPSVMWSLHIADWSDSPVVGVSARRGIVVLYSLPTLTAWTVSSPRTAVWSLELCGGYAALGIDVSDDVDIVVATCESYVTALNVTDGTAMWTAAQPLVFRGVVVPAASPMFAPQPSPNARPLVLGLVQGAGPHSSVLYIDALNGTVAFTANVSCTPSTTVQAAMSGPSNPAARGESSDVLPPNIFSCADGRHFVADLASGNVTMLGPVVAASTRHNTLASIDTAGTVATFVDARTGAVSVSAAFRPPFESAPRLSFVAADVIHDRDVLVGAVRALATITAYVHNARLAAFEPLWSVPVSEIIKAAGFVNVSLPLMERRFALSQPAAEEAQGSVVGFMSVGLPYGAAVDVLFRLSLSSGAILAASNVTTVGGSVSSFFLFTPAGVAPTTSFRSRYFVQTADYTALIDARTLRPVYVNSQFLSSGAGALLPPSTEGSDGEVSFLAKATEVGGAGAQLVGRWGLAHQTHSLIAPSTIPVTAVDDGSADVILLRSVTEEDATVRPVLVRRGAMGVDAGSLVWTASLPESLSSTRYRVGAPFNSAVSDTAVVVFAIEGVFFYSLATGAVTTTVTSDMLRSQCPMEPTVAWRVFTLEPGASDGAVSPVFARPGSASSLVVGVAGACVLFFNTRRELVVYRIPLFAASKPLHSYALYAPGGHAAPAVTAVFSGVAERWTLPVSFVTPSPRGAPLPVVDYMRRVSAVRAWVANLEVLEEGHRAVSVIASHTLFVSDSTSVYGVDMRSGTLLWRFSEYPNTAVLPLRVERGKVFFLSNSSATGAHLVVLDAFALAPPHRVLKVVPLAPFGGDLQPPSPVIGGRVIVFQSNVRLLGIDTETLDLRWNVTGTAGPQSHNSQSWVQPVPARRGTPLFGTFAAVPAKAAHAPVGVFDAATGRMLAAANTVGHPLSVLGVTCNAAASDQRCGVVFGAVPLSLMAPSRTVVAPLPATTAVPHPLPAPTGPTPVSPSVPRGFRFVEPTPRNQPPAPLPVQRGSVSPVLKFSALANANYVFAAAGLVVSHSLFNLFAVHEATGTTAWKVTFNSTMRSMPATTSAMATDSSHIVVLRNAGGAALVTIYDVLTGAQVLERRVPGIIGVGVFLHGATLGRTVCHVYGSPGTRVEGAACYDLATGATAFHRCRSGYPVSDLRPNPSRTAIIMSCSGDSVAAIVRSHGRPTWERRLPGATPSGAEWIPTWPDAQAPTLPVGLLVRRGVYGNVLIGTVNTDSVDTSHQWTVNVTAVFTNVGLNTTQQLGSVTALSTRFVGLQSQSVEAVVDMVTRRVVFAQSYPSGAVCCEDLSCCGTMRLLSGGKTVVSVSAQRGTVVAYDASTGATNWVSADVLTSYLGSEFVVTSAAVVGAAPALVVGNGYMLLFNADTGALVWTTSSPSAGPIAALGSQCVWGSVSCYAYALPPTVVTAAPPQRILALPGRILVTDGSNIYTRGTSGGDGPADQVQHVTPSAAGFSGAFLFGGPRSTRFLISQVNGRNWIFDTEHGMAAVHAFDFPLSFLGRAQAAQFRFGVAVGAEHGGAAYLPGDVSGVLAVVASTVAAKATFVLKFWQTEVPVAAPLSVYRRALAAAAPMPGRVCGVVVPVGTGVAVVDCVRMQPWWTTPTPAAEEGIPVRPPIVAGDYLVFFSIERLVCVSTVTGQLAWQSRLVMWGAASQAYVWNGTAFFLTTDVAADFVLLAFDLRYDTALPPDMNKSPVFEADFSNGGVDYFFAPGMVVSPGGSRMYGWSLSDGSLLWASELAVEASPTLPVYLHDGTLFLISYGLVAVDLRSGEAATVLSTASNQVVPITNSSLATCVGPTTVQVLNVTAAPPLPPAARGPAFGLPPASYPAASPTTTPAPTLAPGAVLPSLGCVSRVVGASEDFVACVDAEISTAYDTAAWGRNGATFRTCPSLTHTLHDCGTSYLAKMGLECPAGAAHVKALFADLRASRLFGACPAAGPAQCGDGGKSAALCDVMKGDMTVAGVATLKPGQHIAAGFEFPAPPSFGAAPQPPSSQPRRPRGLATTFAVRYVASVAPPTAAELGFRLTAFLHIHYAAVHVQILASEGTVAGGQWVFFNVTAPGAEEVAEALQRHTEADVAEALGGIQFGFFFERLSTARPSAPPSKIDPTYIAAAAVVGAVLSALIVGAVVFVVMRRSARPSNSSMAGPPAVMSQRELKSMNEAMLGSDPASPYEEA